MQPSASMPQPPVLPLAAGPDPVAATTGRLRCGAGCAFTLLFAAWLWIGIPQTPDALPIGRLLALAWFILCAAWPAGFFWSFALALPWFGNNPGGPHHLYLLEFAAAGLVARHLFDRALGRSARRQSPLDPWVTLFVAWSWITLLPTIRWAMVEFHFTRSGYFFVAMNHYVTSPTFGPQLAIKLALAAGIYVHLRDRPWSVRALARWFALACAMLLLASLAGLGDYAGWISLAWWRGENPFITAFGFRRLQSLYWHSGWFAQYLTALAPAVAVAGWFARRGRFRLAGLFATLLLAVTMLLTMQRAGWLSFATGLTVATAGAVWLNAGSARRRWILAALGGAALFVLLAASLALVNDDFRQRAVSLFTFRDRADIWRGALGMIRKHPFTGYGLGNYFQQHLWIYPQGHPLFELRDKGNAHNFYLHLWAERGLPGLIFGAGVHLGALLLALRRFVRPPAGAAPLERPLMLALAAGLAALAVDGLFQYFPYVRVIELLAWCFIGWIAGAHSIPAPAHPPRRRGLLLLPALLIPVLVYENLTFFMPWRLAVGDINYRISGKVVRLPIPRDARRVKIPVASLDQTLASPDQTLAVEPVRYTLRLGDKILAEHTFTTVSAHEFVIDIPPGARGPIIIEASRTWPPFFYGLRTAPKTEIGVMWLKPVAIELE